MKKILFLDRDGTLVLEPKDYQIDSLDKVIFYPKVFQYLSRIVNELDYELVMVTNQDGLGTESHPEANFWPAHQKIMQAFENEGITFLEVLIDRTFKEENAPTRKPQIGMVLHYLGGDFDIEHSFVIGDRITDMLLAKNMGAKGIWLRNEPDLGLEEIPVEDREELDLAIALETTSWEEIHRFLTVNSRSVRELRKTRETEVEVTLNLDGQGRYRNSTGIGFFDHMLDQLARHGQLDLEVSVKGDLHIDEHHTIEDTAIVLGTAFRRALGDKRGIERYGHCLLPMDETLAQVAIDFSGRPWLVWSAQLRREKVGGFPIEMAEHFFKTFSDHAACNLNIQVEGKNDHHQIEAIFKAVARSIRMAVAREAGNAELPTTKGLI